MKEIDRAITIAEAVARTHGLTLADLKWIGAYDLKPIHARYDAIRAVVSECPTLTLKELAFLFGCNRYTIYRAARSERIEARRRYLATSPRSKLYRSEVAA